MKTELLQDFWDQPVCHPDSFWAFEDQELVEDREVVVASEAEEADGVAGDQAVEEGCQEALQDQDLDLDQDHVRRHQDLD